MHLLMILALSAVADPPSPCDPADEGGDPAMTGYCITEGRYAEIGLLRARLDERDERIAALEDEVEALEGRVEAGRRVLDESQAGHRTACEAAVGTVRRQCDRELDRARGGGFVPGLTAGAVAGGVIALTGAALGARYFREVSGARGNTRRVILEVQVGGGPHSPRTRGRR